jgi:hypothetical protein
MNGISMAALSHLSINAHAVNVRPLEAIGISVRKEGAATGSRR